MAYKFCPLSCVIENRRKQICNIQADADGSSEEWDALSRMVFCTDGNKEPPDMSHTCWYCDIENNASGKFVAKKSSDPVPEEVRRVQEILGFCPGEPLTKHNIHKIIPSWINRRKLNPRRGGTSTSASTPLQVASPNVPRTLKRRDGKTDDTPLKKYANDRRSQAFPRVVSQHSAF